MYQCNILIKKFEKNKPWNVNLLSHIIIIFAAKLISFVSI